MNKKRILLTAAACCIIAVLCIFMFKSDEAKIKKKLDLLERTASKDKDDGAYALLSKVENLTNLFTEDCYIKLEPPIRTVHTRSSLAAHFTTALRMVSYLKISFHDINITIDPEAKTAEAVLTATAEGPEAEGIYAREVILKWVKQEGTWLITSVEEHSPLR